LTHSRRLTHKVVTRQPWIRHRSGKVGRLQTDVLTTEPRRQRTITERSGIHICAQGQCDDSNLSSHEFIWTNSSIETLDGSVDIGRPMTTSRGARTSRPNIKKLGEYHVLS